MFRELQACSFSEPLSKKRHRRNCKIQILLTNCWLVHPSNILHNCSIKFVALGLHALARIVFTGRRVSWQSVLLWDVFSRIGFVYVAPLLLLQNCVQKRGRNKKWGQNADPKTGSLWRGSLMVAPFLGPLVDSIFGSVLWPHFWDLAFGLKFVAHSRAKNWNAACLYSLPYWRHVSWTAGVQLLWTPIKKKASEKLQNSDSVDQLAVSIFRPRFLLRKRPHFYSMRGADVQVFCWRQRQKQLFRVGSLACVLLTAVSKITFQSMFISMRLVDSTVKNNLPEYVQ